MARDCPSPLACPNCRTPLRTNWSDTMVQILSLYCPRCFYRINFAALRAARAKMLAQRRNNLAHLTPAQRDDLSPAPNPWPRTTTETAPRTATAAKPDKETSTAP